MLDMNNETDSNFTSSEDDDEFSSITNSSEDDEEDDGENAFQQRTAAATDAATCTTATSTVRRCQHENATFKQGNAVTGKTNNLQLKLFQRERCFAPICKQQFTKHAFQKVPNHLRFCLEDIIPLSERLRHIFMGLTACGQFMLSYTVRFKETNAERRYVLGSGYHYKLHFWWFRPHAPLVKYFSCVLFDDHGVDSIKFVTMTQWKHYNNSRLLIVHGAGEDETETSYLTYTKVPKLGCVWCKQLQEQNQLENAPLIASMPSLCLNCNLTVHTKYSTVETDRHFNPYVNLICPERMLVMANGFVHMLRIDIEESTLECTAMQPNTLLTACQTTTPNEKVNNGSPTAAHNADDIVARIIADFSDIETPEQMNAGKEIENISVASACDELVLACGIDNTSSCSAAHNSLSTMAATSKAATSSRVGLIHYAGRRHGRIITKSFRNGITTVDLQSRVVSATATSSSSASNAYEFSEDNEKCEKISTLRKRRLAEKKYEFSEDNSENIIPYTKTRMEQRSSASTCSAGSFAATRNLSRTVFQSSPCASPSSSPRALAQPQQGFRSPPACHSSSTAVMRSPSYQMYCFGVMSKPPSPAPTVGLVGSAQSMAIFKPLGTLSPLQVAMTKRNYFDKSGSMSPNTNVPFLSPRREDLPRIMEVPLQVTPPSIACTKKFKRRYVDGDDAASVITSEEDDCTSPGYYTSLPMEVHGAGYSEMQMISQTTYQRLRCASVVISQHSFDLEAYTYCVIAALCQKNQKSHEVLYDWTCEAITVCPLSNTIIFLLMAQFSAKALDSLPVSNCINCLNEFVCGMHMGPYECRILFSWNMETGESVVLDYGELLESKPPYLCISPLKRTKNVNIMTLAQKAKTLAKEMAGTLSQNMQIYANNLRVLDCNISKSKTSLIDEDNMIEFHLKRPRNIE